MTRARVTVIGAGVGGLVAAVELASQGAEVTVVERAARAGGKMREVSVLGRPIDAGPTVLTMRPVFEQIFAAAGSRLEEHLTLEPLKILARHAWDADQRLDLHADLDRATAAISEFAGSAEARRYQRFCENSRRVFATLDSTFIKASRPNPLSLVARVAGHNPAGLANIRPFSSYWRALGKELKDPRLQQLFGRYATYMGSSPYSAPATLMLIAHVEQIGVWTVAGGMYRIAEALSRLATGLGVEFRYQTEARQVLLSSNRVTGVELDNSESIQADAVVINADAAAISAGRFGAAVSRAVPAVKPAQRSLSALTWAAVAQTRGFPLLRHTVFFSDNYRSEFDDIFQRARLPQTPTVYVCAQDRGGEDSELVGAERLLCLVNAPARGDQGAFSEAEIDACRERVLRLFDRCGLQLQLDSETASATTPDQFERLFPATGGALYGPASHGWQASFRRPGARTRVPGLYVAGGSTHPGAGVPMAALSGRLAAAALLQDRKP